MKTFSIFFVSIFFSLVALGQNISGLIATQNDVPIADAYVFSPRQNVHTHTNELGAFTLNKVRPGDTIQVVYLGYRTKQLILSEKDFEQKRTIILEEIAFDLEAVSVNPDLNPLAQAVKMDLYANPVNSSQEVLQKVPGLFIGQHAGGGKAEQIFLRGFDIDHGTDVRISVDGMPVNMVSHAHGQGYADLHFLIPETIQNIDFGKGPHYEEQGNFATAGYVDFSTKNRIDQSKIKVEYGRFNTLRTVGLFNLLNHKKESAYLAGEYLLTDGPFDSPQNFKRVNLMGKYRTQLKNGQLLNFTASHFQSKWDASGQIPERAVNAGLIGRFGAIDDTEGGSTSRSNLALNLLSPVADDAFLKSKVYFSKYDFELYSNFTFFLNDPVNGDQIRQKENRNIFGLESAFYKNVYASSFDLEFKAGLGFRYDDVNEVELSHTANRRTTLESASLGDIDESNLYGFASAEFSLGQLLIKPALRFDYFRFDYINELAAEYQSLSEDKARLSPKLNIAFSPSNRWQLYLKSSLGFHSNDTRVVVAQNGRSILPAAYGTDLGAVWKPAGRLMIDAALWSLFLEQEFVYVGDEGIVEPSGKTRRLGLDLGLQYQLMDNLFFDTDFNYAYARSVEEEEGDDFIPLAPALTSTGGLAYRSSSGFYGSFRYRYLHDRPANEDYSLIAKGYLVSDVSVGYEQKNWEIGLAIENLFNTEWNETQFATLSRLEQETKSLEEIHFTPGRPFFIKLTLGAKF